MKKLISLTVLSVFCVTQAYAAVSKTVAPVTKVQQAANPTFAAKNTAVVTSQQTIQQLVKTQTNYTAGTPISVYFGEPSGVISRTASQSGTKIEVRTERVPAKFQSSSLISLDTQAKVVSYTSYNGNAGNTFTFSKAANPVQFAQTVQTMIGDLKAMSSKETNTAKKTQIQTWITLATKSLAVTAPKPPVRPCPTCAIP